MRSLLLPPARAVEATTQQLVATGATGGSAWGEDPVDGDRYFRPAGSPVAGRPVPAWTLERARMHSVAAYRSNPLARAILDTYTAFCVGDSGVSLQVTSPQVRQVVEEEFWADPRNALGARQELLLRTGMLTGELLLELLTGPVSGRVRISPIDTSRITTVTLWRDNPLWPERVWVRAGVMSALSYRVADIDDDTGLRDGQVLFWAPWRALATDTRSMPFLAPVLDWLDSYDQVLSNLIDRTALARYLVWDVTVDTGTAAPGDAQRLIDAYVEARGGLSVPPSGSVEVHNQQVKWEAKTADSGAFEDVQANRSVLTSIAAGAGLAKTWLAEPEDANRATSLTMAEPVRRRVAGVQSVWLACQTELARFAVDRAVAARRLPATVTAADPKTGQEYEIPASRSVQAVGPEVAAADAQITAQVLLNLSTGLEKLVATGALTREAAGVAARKAWEDYVGVSYTADLDSPAANPDDLASHVDDPKKQTRLRPVKTATAGGQQ